MVGAVQKSESLSLYKYIYCAKKRRQMRTRKPNRARRNWTIRRMADEMLLTRECGSEEDSPASQDTA